MTFDERGDGFPALTVNLELNLTRFLSQKWNLGLTPASLRELSPEQRLNWLTNSNHPTVTQDLRWSLNGDDNFTSDSCLRTGTPPRHLDWLVSYVELVLQFLADQIGAARRRSIAAGHTVNRASNPLIAATDEHLIIPLRNWSLPQLEVYWEFWSPNAVADAGNLAGLVERVATTSALTNYEPLTRTTDLAVLGISARAGNRSARTKVYAKLRDRIRVEVAYDRNVRDVERHATRGDDGDDLQSYLPLVARAASLRADAMLNAAFSAIGSQNAALSQREIGAFLEALAREAGSPAIFSMFIRQLLAQGMISRLPRFPEHRLAVERLVARRYLVPVSAGTSRTRTAFVPAPPYDRIIAALSGLTAPVTAPVAATD